MALPYPQHVREEAIRLRALGLSSAEIGRTLGVGTNTVVRWLNPAYAERTRVASRQRKRKIRGICERCGGETRCCRPGGSLPSLFCTQCSHELQRERRIWTREKVIEAIQEWTRRRGEPPVSTEWIRTVVDADGYRYPPRSSVYRSQATSRSPFPKWADAIEAAGLPRPEIGHKRDYLPGLIKRKPRNAGERRARAVAALQRALAKENRDGNRDRERNDHDRAGG